MLRGNQSKEPSCDAKMDYAYLELCWTEEQLPPWETKHARVGHVTRDDVVEKVRVRPLLVIQPKGISC